MPAYQRILVPIDGSENANKALGAALDLARDMNAHVKLMHSLDDLMLVSTMEYSGDVLQLARDGAKKVLDDGLALARAAGVQADITLLEFLGGRLGDTVADLAREWQADLIVVGTHGRRGIGRALLGSGAEQIIRQAPVPVLVVRSEAKT